MAIVVPIGQPENESERKSIQFFRDRLPDDYIIYHNFEITSNTNFPYEYDLLIIGRYSLFCIEVKGYKGKITGNAKHWILNNYVTRPSPVPMNNKKAKILKDKIKERKPFIDFFVQALIIISDDTTTISLADDQKDNVLHLEESLKIILKPRGKPISNIHSAIKEAVEKQFKPVTSKKQIGDYRILESLEKNNLFDTFLCEHDIITNQKYLIKVYELDIYADKDVREKQRDRIKRDAIALHSLSPHPNVVRAEMPFNWEDTRFVLPLHWIDGITLEGQLSSTPGVELTRTLDIMKQVCAGLHHAHINQIIHRNVSPENIIITEGEGVKVVNFDNARVEKVNLQTIATQLDRTFDKRYAAPEVWMNASSASVQSDIYSLGVIFFELLTGQTPYNELSLIFELKRLPDKPSEIVTGLSEDFDEIIDLMCRFDPAERPKSLVEVIEFLNIIS